MQKLACRQGSRPPFLRFSVVDIRDIGDFLIALSDEGICWTGMTAEAAKLRAAFPQAVLMRDDSLKKLGPEIAAVWREKRESLSCPLVLYGTEFQIGVWRALLKIGFGRTATYQDIASRIGRPKAVRAVGSAVGANPLTLLVPCHRVIAKSGNKLSFGWGAEAKKRLLDAEGVFL